MNDNQCLNCKTPLPFSITSNEVICSTCGDVNTIIIENKTTENKVEKTQIIKKNPLWLRIIQGILSVIGFVILMFWASERLGYDLKKYFYFYILVPEKVELTANDVYNFSYDGIENLLKRFGTQLNNRRWFDIASSRSKLSSNQIRACLGTNIIFNDTKGVWVVEFTCPTNLDYFSEGNDVAKEAKSRFLVFLKANKPLKRD